MQLDRLLGLGDVLVDADDHALARLDLLLPAESGTLDLPLHEALLDRLTAPPSSSTRSISSHARASSSSVSASM